MPDTLSFAFFTFAIPAVLLVGLSKGGSAALSVCSACR